MNNRINAIKTLFISQQANKIIESYYDFNKGKKAVQFTDKTGFICGFKQQAKYKYTDEEAENVYEIVCGEWSKNTKGEHDVLNMIANYAEEVLHELDYRPVVKYLKAFDWRGVSHLLGEDIFTTALLAKSDAERRRSRENFDWRPIIDTDNKRLRGVLNKGIAENHFHLKGSAPHFHLAWISLMNKVDNRSAEFKKLKKQGKKYGLYRSGEENNHQDIQLLVLKAAYIRMIMSTRLFHKVDIPFEKDILESKTISEFRPHIPDLKREINFQKNEYGYAFGKNKPDYMIDKNYPVSNIGLESLSMGLEYKYLGNVLLAGERRFLYEFFKEYFLENQWCKDNADLFYAYLIIKTHLRAEIIQCNKDIGFKNFADYQDRKSVFLKNDKFLSSAVLCLAVSGSVNDEMIKSFEARIAPEDSRKELKDEIYKIDSALHNNNLITGHDTYSELIRKLNKDMTFHEAYFNQLQETIFYTMHFIKSEEQRNNIFDIAYPRNYKIRNQSRIGAIALANLRKENSDKSNRILGIDTANFEIGCRPEVFAQNFRFLRHADYENTKRHFVPERRTSLGRTYHAGEDFLGLVDGLRAIDECIRFLEFGQGDRIGHALALGIYPKDYYRLKGRKIVTSKMDLLDSIAWLIARARKINDYFTDIDKLRKLFSNYYNQVYVHSKTVEDLNEMTPEIYYDAWKLRGDNPRAYEKPFDRNFFEKESIVSEYDQYRFQKSPKLDLIRNNKKCYNLYQAYHFDNEARKRGEERTSFEVTTSMIKLVETIQMHLMNEINQKNISIESNPTSNYLIGTFGRYDKHPIKRFFNLGLETNQEEFDSCPQLSVSINTDDQGVFSTYLENEYALMALAMELAEDEDGEKRYKPAMIYDWLDKIRQMGLEQSFLLRTR